MQGVLQNLADTVLEKQDLVLRIGLTFLMDGGVIEHRAGCS